MSEPAGYKSKVATAKYNPSSGWSPARTPARVAVADARNKRRAADTIANRAAEAATFASIQGHAPLEIVTIDDGARSAYLATGALCRGRTHGKSGTN